MGQILKLKEGDKVRTRREETDALERNLAELNELYSTLDANTKAQVDMLTANEDAFLKAQGLSSRDERRFRLDMSNRKLNLIKGAQSYNPVQTGTATTNIFGNLSRDEVNTLANDLTRKTLVEEPANPTIAAQPSDNSTGSLHFTYNWRNPAFDFAKGDSSVKDRVRLVAEGLIDQINRLKSTSDQNGFIHNFDKNNLDYAYSAIPQLQGILDKLNSSDYTDNQAFEDLQKIVASGKLGVDAEDYKKIFSEFWDPEAIEKAKKFKGYTPATNTYNKELQDILKANNYTVQTKDGHNYIMDSEGNIITGQAYNYINDNYLLGDQGGYNQGTFVNPETGEIWSGDVRTLTDVNSPFYSIYKNYIDPNNDQGIYYRNENLYYEDDINDDTYSKDSMIMALQNALGGDFTFYDVSNYFAGDTPVIAVSPDGKPLQKTPYGTPIIDEKTRLFTLNEKGELVEFSDRNSYKYSGYGEKVKDDYQIWDLDPSWKQETPAFDAHDHMSNKNWWTGLWDSYNTSGWNTTRIEENPIEWLDNVLSAWDILTREKDLTKLDERQRAIIDNFNLSPDQAGSIAAVLQIIDKLKGNPEMKPLLKKHANAIRQFKIAYHNIKNTDAQIKKLGGVIYAKKGTRMNQLDSTEKPSESPTSAFDVISQAQNEGAQHGYSEATRWAVGNQKVSDEFKAEDALRLAAVAQDLVGIVTNFVPTGVGQAISAGSGITSMATNLAADIADESVGGWQVAKNAGINLGLAALNLIPGLGAAAKTRKIFGFLIKSAPKIFAGLNAMGVALDEDNRKSWEKVMTGDISNLTRDDLKNISWTVSTVAGGLKAGRRTVRTHQKNGSGHSIAELVKPQATGEKAATATGTSGKKYTITTEAATEARRLAGEGKVKEANAYLQKATKSSDNFDFTEERPGAFQKLSNIKNAAKKKLGKATPEETTPKKYNAPIEDIEQTAYNTPGIQAFLQAERTTKSGKERKHLSDREYFLLQELGLAGGKKNIFMPFRSVEKGKNTGVDIFNENIARFQKPNFQTPIVEESGTPKSESKPESKPKAKPASNESGSTKGQSLDSQIQSLESLHAVGDKKIHKAAFRYMLKAEKNNPKLQDMLQNKESFEELRAQYRFKTGGSLSRLQEFIKNK